MALDSRLEWSDGAPVFQLPLIHNKTFSSRFGFCDYSHYFQWDTNGEEGGETWVVGRPSGMDVLVGMNNQVGAFRK